MSRILVIDDEGVMRAELERLLVRAGHEVVTAGELESARDQGFAAFDLVLSDVRLPGFNGDALLEEVEGTPVILMTAYGTVRSAVDAMKRGAVDYLAKPFDPEELLLVVHRTLRRSGERRSAHPDEALGDAKVAALGMVGSSPAMQRVYGRIAKVAPTDATVLVLGESGTGKELVARAIHQRSPRAAKPFVAVNCASIPETLIESELFGHERGAFTGAVSASAGLVQAADEGTLFLDEIGELPLPAQARLLRVIQESEVRRVGSNKARRVDVRLVAATHRDLPAMVREGTFREDLYFRLKVLDIGLPPLRERGDDVIELAHAFLRLQSERHAAPVGEDYVFSQHALDALRAHAWPGNVRELENAVERAVILHEGGPITPELLGMEIADDEKERESLVPELSMSDSSLEGYFRAFVMQNQDELNETELAKRLGISRKALWERRARMGIPRPKKSKSRD